MFYTVPCMRADITISPSVFNEVYLPYLDEMARTQIFYGGASSGKSVFLAQRDVWAILQGGRNFLICRAVARTIKGSVWNEVIKVITDWGLWELFSKNISDRIITCANGYQMLFVGLDDVEKIKSITPMQGVITDIRIEEATEVDAQSIKQLYKRQRGGSKKHPKRLTLSFNPILQSHHIYEKYFAPIGWADEQTSYKANDGSLSILKTWYIHNKFLTQGDVDDLLNEQDKYYRDVYTFGNWGVLGNLVFTNWVIADLSDPDSEYYLPDNQRTNTRRGGDFGFSNDPAAFVVSHYDKMRRRIYCYKELYETGLTNNVLAGRIKEMGEHRESSTWDSAEPKSIAELNDHGVNAIGARKGADSIRQGIDWLKQQTIIVDKSLVNLQNEMRQYHWATDAGGNLISPPRPVDKNNHLIDGGLRYAYEGDMIEPKRAGTW